MKIKSITLLFCFLFSTTIFADMRKCMLLPVRDSIGGALGFKVFEDVELYLKDSGWCYYTSNSEILNILSNYKKNLDSVLENPRVIKIISEKTGTGSLIKVEIINQIKGVDLAIRVVGDNGEDVYFKERTRLNTDDPKVLSQTIKNWLNIYEKQIPYDGRITGVLGNQFSLNVGTNRSIFEGNEVTIIRPTRKRKHPLLKEIIDWETDKLGSGKIIHSTQSQAQGNVTQYDTTKKLRVGDWVLLDQKSKVGVVEQKKFSDSNDYEFGKLGELSLMFNFGKGSATADNGGTKKIGGTILGVDLQATLWVTRKYWAGIDISRVTGTLSEEEGTIVNGSNSMSNSFFRLKAGYKYLPMGFFYGPQIDAYVGYASYTYGLDTSSADGFTEVTFNGIMFGAKGSIPIQKVIRAHVELSFLFNPGYEEGGQVYGEDDSARNYALEVGGKYLYAPNMTFDLAYGVNSSKASFIGPVRSLTVKQSTLKLGTTFTY
ncbi:MAG: hypothetical protein NXH75_02935 [Halobacteriovoraceae bacterium]|nr:hypothetical protein [Halobacteriovoraceae bacterium]